MTFRVVEEPMTWQEFKDAVDKIASDDTPILSIEINDPATGDFDSGWFHGYLNDSGYLEVL